MADPCRFMVMADRRARFVTFPMLFADSSRRCSTGARGGAYNIGNSDNEIAMRDLANLYTQLVPGCTVSFISYPETYPAGEPQRRCPDLTKARQELGYGSRVDLKTGLTRFIEWARTQSSYRGPPDP